MSFKGADAFHPLNLFKEDLDKCMNCGFCRELCPAIGFYSWEANSPRGRIQMLKSLIDGEIIETSRYLVERVYSCMTCGYCYWRCPAGVNTWKTFEAARCLLKERGVAPSTLNTLVNNILEFRNPFGKPREKRGDWIPSDIALSNDTDLLYWAGCMNSYHLVKESSAIAQLLNLSGIKFKTLGKSEGDCGSLLIRMGFWDVAKEIAEENRSNFKEMEIKTIVTSCPACIETFVNDYRRLFKIDLTKDLGLKFLHSSQILEQLINEGKLTPRKLNLKVGYHDPCYLGRHLQIYNPPRKVISSIPGIELMEPPQSRALSSCCGAGGSQSFKFIHEEEALNQALIRVKQFEEIGVDSIVTACPYCTMNLREGTERLEKKINVYELSTLLMKAIGDKESKPEPS